MRSGKRTLRVVQEVKKIQLRQVVNTPDPWIITASPISPALAGPSIARPIPMSTAAHLVSAAGGISRRKPAPSTKAATKPTDRTRHPRGDKFTTHSGPVLRPMLHPGVELISLK